LPVLGFDIAGTGDLVEDGLVDGLAPDVGPEPIANAIAARLQADRDRPRVRPDFTLPTWETCADQLAQVYCRVAAQRVSRSGAAA
jgi:glycosyltransferase involved in cell wall biosynthesis